MQTIHKHLVLGLCISRHDRECPLLIAFRLAEVIQAVVLGESPKMKEAFLQKRGTQSIRPGFNMGGIQGWLAKLRDRQSEHDQVLDWIGGMITEDPLLRPDSSQLMKKITDVSRGHSTFCGDCCFDDTEPSDFDQSDVETDPVKSPAESLQEQREQVPPEDHTVRALEDRIPRPYGPVPAPNDDYDHLPNQSVHVPTQSVNKIVIPVDTQSVSESIEGEQTIASSEASKIALANRALPSLACPTTNTQALREPQSPIKAHIGHGSSRKESSRARKVAAKARQGSVLPVVNDHSTNPEQSGNNGDQSPEKNFPNQRMPYRPAEPTIPEHLRPIWVQERPNAEATEIEQQELMRQKDEKLGEIRDSFDKDLANLDELIDDLQKLVPLT